MTLASETPSSPGASGKRLTSAAPFFIEAPPRRADRRRRRPRRS